MNKNLSDSVLRECLSMARKSDKIRLMSGYVQHGDTSCLTHSYAVAFFASRMAEVLGLKVRRESLVKGAMLHDYFLYDWHSKNKEGRWHAFRHPSTALKNATRDYDINEVERDIIEKHMFPLTLRPPRYRESVLVCLADKGCALYETFARGCYPRLRARIGT